MQLRIAGTVENSIVDGEGIRYTIFVQGCPHGCPECHNPQTHSFEENKRVTLGQLMSEIKENPLLYGVTFSGGEPFCQPGPLAILGQQIKKAGMHLMCYSGYTYEQLLKRAETEPDVTALLAKIFPFKKFRQQNDLCTISRCLPYHFLGLFKVGLQIRTALHLNSCYLNISH